MRTVDPVKHQAKRQQLVHAAASVFAAKGYDATTTAEICRAAGVSSGNLFHYFGSKREIFAAIYEDTDGEKAVRLAEAQHSDDPYAALLDVVDVLVAPATEPLVPPLVIEAMLRAYRDPELEAKLSQDDAAEQAAIESLISKGVAAGRIDASLDPHNAASWLMLLIGSVYIRAATNPDEFDPAEQLPMLRRMVERFLRP